VDVFPRDLRTGYWGDCTRTFAKGAPAEEIVSMHAAVAQAHKAATGKIRDGAWGERIHEEVKKTFSERGYFNNDGKRGSFGFTHGTGHGVGLEVHEEPRIASGAGPLFAGNVVTVEPGLYYQKTGGVRIEDLVAVRKNGCENLTSLEKGLAID
jgi:Xaa-Pro aminopeptidase